MTEALETLQHWMDDTENIVCYTGSGLSQESGVPDYRLGASDHASRFAYPPQTILSRPFFERKPEPFFQYYREEVLAPLLTADPNAAHHKIAALEATGKLRMLITQNIDELHHEAGSRKLLTLHGSVTCNNCPRCERFLSALEIYERTTAPTCDVDMCGGIITPDIWLYGDALKQELLNDAIYYALTARVFIVIGTSLSEYPAAAIVPYYTGDKLVLIHEKEDPLDARANLIVRTPAAAFMEQLSITPSLA